MRRKTERVHLKLTILWAIAAYGYARGDVRGGGADNA